MDWVKLGSIFIVLGLIWKICQWISKRPRIEGEIIDVKVCQIDKPRIGINYQDEFAVNFRIAIDIKFINHRESSSCIEEIWINLKSKKISNKLTGNLSSDRKIDGGGIKQPYFYYKDEVVFKGDDVRKEAGNIPLTEYPKFLINEFSKSKPFIKKCENIKNLINDNKYEINYKITGRKWKIFKINP